MEDMSWSGQKVRGSSVRLRTSLERTDGQRLEDITRARTRVRGSQSQEHDEEDSQTQKPKYLRLREYDDPNAIILFSLSPSGLVRVFGPQTDDPPPISWHLLPSTCSGHHRPPHCRS